MHLVLRLPADGITVFVDGSVRLYYFQLRLELFNDVLVRLNLLFAVGNFLLTNAEHVIGIKGLGCLFRDDFAGLPLKGLFDYGVQFFYLVS